MIMPYHLVFGEDKKGKFVRSSERLHHKKYYYKTESGRALAIKRANKQIKAVLLSELRRGKLKLENNKIVKL